MSCNENTSTNCSNNSSCGRNAFVILIVLYILLAIILGSGLSRNNCYY